MANPALGVRIRERSSSEQRSMDPRTFAVERLGVGDWPRTDHPAARVDRPRACGRARRRGLASWTTRCAWRSTCRRSGRASISAAGRSTAGPWHVEVIDSRQGHEVADRSDRRARRAARAGRRRLRRTTAAGRDDRAARGGRHRGVETVNGDRARPGMRPVRGLRRASGDSATSARPSSPQAIRIAQTRPLGDAWAWSRKNSTGNISRSCRRRSRSARSSSTRRSRAASQSTTPAWWRRDPALGGAAPVDGAWPAPGAACI
jgi:hypothetical protein